ncbi:glycoside hydrolase family 97 protein [Paraflavisolibacter sp. H34]|uniref:glycoside hydrolase family 97 protein n=1 Tax=Huijunlia imazamoxiresistens TaxID=3127457 RepID=UPI0030182C41
MWSNYKRIVLSLLLAAGAGRVAAQKTFTLAAPGGKIQVSVSVGDSIRWSLKNGSETLVQNAVAGMDIEGKPFVGYREQVKTAKTTAVDQQIEAVVAVRQKQIRDHYKELRLQFKSGHALLFRAYDNGAAYRFETAFPDSINVTHETVAVRFPQDNRVFWGTEKNKEFLSHFELIFKDTALSAYSRDEHCGLPLYMATPRGSRMLLTEADLLDYSNLFFFGSGGPAVAGGFPKVIKKERLQGDRTTRIVENEAYIARTAGKRAFPWRLVMVAADDKDLLSNNLVYQLASPSVLPETGWIKPGKVAWDWWNDNNIYGVPFRSGINNTTYKYYIDFAAKYGLEYIVLDEGWSKTTWDLLHPRDSIDIPELVQYGKTKGVDVILWALWQPLDRDMDRVLDQFAAWGVKGVKVDFMARADQYMVNFYERVAVKAAARKLLLDLHGAYKPVGLDRKYPNILTYEGVRGLENYKWSNDEATPPHEVTLPFTRMVLGGMDFTPGAMHNARLKDFHIRYNSPMSLGTRAHQAAMYAVYESPLQMLADNPSNYLQEPACTRFIAQFPTTWDATVPLEGKIGEYVAVARRKGNKWYIGAMTNWTGRTLKLNLDFLEKGRSYSAEILADGPNADKYAQDHTLSTATVAGGGFLEINMQPGGGWAAVLSEN